jgi:photosystem II reaction center protein PsbM
LGINQIFGFHKTCVEAKSLVESKKDLYNMTNFSLKSFLLFCIASAAYAFVHNGAARSMIRAGAMAMKFDLPKTIASMSPAALAIPAFAATDALTSSMPLSLEVTFSAYLAVLLGTFVPVTFLIVLYSQSEARKAGARGVK